MKIHLFWIDKNWKKNGRTTNMHFTGLSGRHSVLERPLSGVNGHPFFS